MSERPPLDGLEPELLDRYLAGESTEGETALVRRWLMANPDAARRLAQYLARLDADDARPPMPTVAESWRAIQARVDARPNAMEAPAAPRPARWSRGATGVAAAACALLAAGLAAVAYVRSRDGGPVIDAAPRHTFATAPRERSELRLPDGTRVRLAPGSHLRVATDFGAERRDVTLEGEAFFEVTHDARRPFTVFAGNTSARDLGTAFSVRAYPTDSVVVVAVREGEVALTGAGRLRAGDVARVTVEGRATVRRGVRVDSLLGWMSGRLVFSDAPLGTVVDDLRRWYDVDVQLGDPSIASLPFTGTLADVSPDAAVELVAAALGLKVRHEGTRVVLAPTPGRTPRR